MRAATDSRRRDDQSAKQIDEHAAQSPANQRGDFSAEAEGMPAEQGRARTEHPQGQVGAAHEKRSC